MQDQPNELTAKDRQRIWIEVCLLLALVALPLWVGLAVPSYQPLTLFQDGLVRLSHYLPICGLVLYLVWQSGRGWSHYGLGKNHDFLGVLSFVGGLVAVGLFMIWTSDTIRQAFDPRSMPQELTAYGPVPRSVSEWLTMWPVLLIGAAFEELVFRGFITARLHDATQSKWIAILLPSLVFGSYHIYQGIYEMIGAMVYGILFSWMFLEWRRLKALILAHFAFNAWAFAVYAF